jgi:signal transduction histidine kinase
VTVQVLFAITRSIIPPPVTLGLGGEVLGAEEGAPSGWVGAVLADHAGVPAALRDAARAVVLAARQAGGLKRARVEVPELDASIDLIALPAIGLHRAATDVRALLRHSVAALERQARALDVDLSVTIHPDVPETVVLDPEKIAWTVSALAGNSMRYVRRGTRHMPGGSIAVTATRGAAIAELLLVVEDDGPGIPAEVLERMFDRTPGAPISTGLGLKVARDIVAAHGGSLELASSTDDANHGTTATLRLPVP